MTDCFNSIYKKLVSSEEDFIGMVAYSIYKNSKIAYIENYFSEHNTKPDKELLKEFYRNSQCEPSLELYTSKAEKIIGAFTTEIAQHEIDGMAHEMRQMKQKMDELERNHKNRLEEEKDTFIKKLDELKPPQWYTGIIQSFIATFLALLFYVIVVVHFNVFGLNDGIEKRITDRVMQQMQTETSPGS